MESGYECATLDSGRGRFRDALDRLNHRKTGSPIARVPELVLTSELLQHTGDNHSAGALARHLLRSKRLMGHTPLDAIPSSGLSQRAQESCGRPVAISSAPSRRPIVHMIEPRLAVRDSTCLRTPMEYWDLPRLRHC